MDKLHEELREHLEAIKFWTSQREFAEKNVRRNIQRANDVRSKINEEEKKL